jgi:hypothetical protein
MDISSTQAAVSSLAMPNQTHHNGLISITNYDVLTEPPVNGTFGRYQLDHYKSHVGNNRLQVFLNLYQQGYDDARLRGDTAELKAIVEKIVATVCQQCVPPGRFLWNANSSSTTPTPTEPLWQTMQPDQVQNFLHAVLQPQPPPPAVAVAPPFSHPMDNPKRRRRSSLLRRSASESMLVDSKKKMFRMGNFPQRQVKEEPTWSSSRNTNMNGLILSLNRVDVILTSTRDALDPNSQSVGNNRLHILVAMRSGQYQQATIDGRERILDEIIETVNTFWKGRFLTESDDGYELISKEDVRNSLRSIFDMRSSQNLLSMQRASGDGPVILPDQNLALDSSSDIDPVPLVAPQSGPGLLSRSPRLGLPRQTSTGMLHQSPPTMVARNAHAALARQVSASVLPTEPIMNIGDVGDLRSAAVRSLQKQRARQTIANKLEQVSSSVRNRHHNGNLNGLGLPVPPTTTFMEVDHQEQETNHNHNNNNDDDTSGGPHLAFASSARKRQSTFFGALDPSIMEELAAEDFDDD